ncbi:bola-like protein [Trametes coccinea BRFM310]|uniref:Bola-like protein n=1 Tax=Trametes coccinea (strain BRFM310) TaxID=1353009 RepID=A0A1Y2ISY2_TRAC3|nr:bola-like protein [Trametes coccinea BRFM310]
MPISAVDLENAIRAAMPVTHLEIEDTSNGCGENYSVFVVSQAFEGKNTLARHRFINEVLKNEIAQMHAFSQKTLTPAQWEAQIAKQTS